MMGFLDELVTSAVQIADEQTADLQVGIVHEPFVSVTRAGKPTYGAKVTRQATVVLKTRQFHTADGKDINIQGPITFLRDEPIKVKDRLTLPDGTVAVIQDIEKPLKPSGGGYVTKVYIG